MSKNKSNASALLGNGEPLDSVIELTKKTKLKMTDLIAEAHKASGLSVDDWNKLDDKERDGHMVAALEKLQQAALASEKPEKKFKAIEVKSIRAQFYRAGICFQRQPQVLRLDQLGKDKVAAIRAEHEKNLIVTDTTVEASE